LLVLGGPRISELDITSTDRGLKVALQARDATGQTVTLKVVRDGRILAELPTTTLGADGLATVEAAWQGPRWTLGGSEEPHLQTLVAELESGATAWVRFGVRHVTLDQRRLNVDGKPLYLAAQRYMPGRASPRQEVADMAWWLARSGSNALELHGVIHSDEVLQAADELGIPVVFTPRCAGVARNDRPGQLTPALARFIARTNADMASSRRQHPSILMWSQEEDPVSAYPRLYSPFRSGQAILLGRDSQGLDERRLQEAISRKRIATWINELPWKAHSIQGKSLTQRLEPLLNYHRPWGTGLLLPHIYHRQDLSKPVGADVEQLGRDYQALMQQFEVPSLALGDRRGPAELYVQVRRDGKAVAGVPVLLHLAEQPTLASVSDMAGLARFSVDYAGSGAVSTLDGGERTEVFLRPGRYTDGRWVPSRAQATLNLSSTETSDN
jgi:hypothetical protein